MDKTLESIKDELLAKRDKMKDVLLAEQEGVIAIQKKLIEIQFKTIEKQENIIKQLKEATNGKQMN